MSCRRTLSEIDAMCTKAARGAGCPWGLAQEAGMAARTLSNHGLKGAETVAKLLKTPRACACDGRGTAECALQEIARLSDAPPRERLVLNHSIAASLLLISPLIRMTTETRGWQMSWQNGKAVCTPGGIQLEGEEPAPVEIGIEIAPFETSGPVKLPEPLSTPVHATSWDVLEHLATKTYVPESERSKMTGAGPDDAETD